MMGTNFGYSLMSCSCLRRRGWKRRASMTAPAAPATKNARKNRSRFRQAVRHSARARLRASASARPAAVRCAVGSSSTEASARVRRRRPERTAVQAADRSATAGPSPTSASSSMRRLLDPLEAAEVPQAAPCAGPRRRRGLRRARDARPRLRDSLRWNVMAKRWASSRRRVSRNSSGERLGQDDGVLATEQEDALGAAPRARVAVGDLESRLLARRHQVDALDAQVLHRRERRRRAGPCRRR